MTATVKQAVNNLLSGQTAHFRDDIHDILTARVNDSIDVIKQGVAASMFDSEEDQEADEETNESEDE